MRECKADNGSECIRDRKQLGLFRFVSNQFCKKQEKGEKMAGAISLRKSFPSTEYNPVSIEVQEV